MAKINIAIADSDEMYLNHISNYLIENVHTFEVFSFTTKGNLVKFVMDKSNKIDIVALSEDLIDNIASEINAPVKILLSDGTYTDMEGFEVVNKYQKAEKFINDILLIYAEKTGRVEAVATGDKETKILGFYSPVGGSGKTTLALAASVSIARQGKRVFYLNAEKINSTVSLLNEGENSSMSDVYLALKTKGSNVGLRIMANKCTDSETNISYIKPSESSLEINEITSAEFVRLLSEFEGLGEFDYVTVDFDSEFTKEKAKILEKCDKIIVPFLAETASLSKARLFIRELGMYDELKEIQDKMIYLINKFTQGTEGLISGSGLTELCDIQMNVAFSPVLSDINNILHISEEQLGRLYNKR